MGKFLSIMRPESYEATQQELEHSVKTSQNVIDWTIKTITNERRIMMNNELFVIGDKVKSWIDTQRPILELAVQEHESATIARERCEDILHKLARKMENELRTDYCKAFHELRIFMQYVDKLAKEQQEIHEDLLKLKDLPPEDVIRCKQELASLSAKVNKNFRMIKNKETEYTKLHEKVDYYISHFDKQVEDMCKEKVEEMERNLKANILPR